MTRSVASASGSAKTNWHERAEACHLAWCAAATSRVAIDTETTGTAYADVAFCVTVAWGDEGHYLELADEASFEVAASILQDAQEWVFHNPKFDIAKMIQAGLLTRDEVSWDRIHDTEAIAHLLDENQVKKLKTLAMAHVGWDDTIEVEYKSKEKRGQTYLVSREKYELDAAKLAAKKALGLSSVKDVRYDMLPREVIIPYAVADAVMTWRLFEKLYPYLRAKDQALQDLYDRERKLSLVLMDAELAGMRVDTQYVDKMVKKMGSDLWILETKIENIVDEPWKDHHTYIMPAFEKVGIKLENTRKETLREIDHPLAELIREWRRQKKLRDYFLAIQREQVDGILHPNFRQHGTKTGRMSSGEVDE